MSGWRDVGTQFGAGLAAPSMARIARKIIATRQLAYHSLLFLAATLGVRFHVGPGWSGYTVCLHGQSNRTM